MSLHEDEPMPSHVSSPVSPGVNFLIPASPGVESSGAEGLGPGVQN